MTLLRAIPRNRRHPINPTQSGASELAVLMEGSTAGALIPGIVSRGFQDLLRAKVSAEISATPDGQGQPEDARLTDLLPASRKAEGAFRGNGL